MVDNEFGYTLWGMDWVRLAEPLRQTRPEPLLPRARSIARNHGVDTVIDGRVVRATIHRGGQASVCQLEVAPLTRATITAAAALIGDPATLGEEDHRALADAAVPARPALAAMDCSCPARVERCLHVLAVCYDLARRVDETPRLALELLGFFDADSPDEELPEPPRWTLINTVDPTDYFGSPAPAMRDRPS